MSCSKVSTYLGFWSFKWILNETPKVKLIYLNNRKAHLENVSLSQSVDTNSKDDCTQCDQNKIAKCL